MTAKLIRPGTSIPTLSFKDCVGTDPKQERIVQCYFRCERCMSITLMYKTHMYTTSCKDLTYCFTHICFCCSCVASHRRCNETILEACHLVLQRWLCDLDPEHLDEESTGRPSPLSEAGNVVWWVRCSLCWRCSTRDVEWCGDTIWDMMGM